MPAPRGSTGERGGARIGLWLLEPARYEKLCLKLLLVSGGFQELNMQFTIINLRQSYNAAVSQTDRRR